MLLICRNISTDFNLVLHVRTCVRTTRLVGKMAGNQTASFTNANNAMNAIKAKFFHLRSELKVGPFISQNANWVHLVVVERDKRDSFFQFSKPKVGDNGEGAFGTCYLVKPNESVPEFKSLGSFLVKQIEKNEGIYDEIARILLITNMGHYGLVESHTAEIEVDGQMKNGPVILIEHDSSENMTVYATMKYIEGTQLSKAIEQKKLTDFDKLRIAVRVADTMNFLHSYKLAHADLSCNNIMLKEGTNDPILIDFGNMRAGGDFSMFDTTAYHTMIYRMYKDCDVKKIPPVVKPMFDNRDNESYSHMSFKDITDKYFEKLSAYHAMVSVVDGATQSSNTVPVKRVGGIFMISFEAMGKSSSFTEYMEQTGISLAEQDKKIQEYLCTHI